MYQINDMNKMYIKPNAKFKPTNSRRIKNKIRKAHELRTKKKHR